MKSLHTLIIFVFVSFISFAQDTTLTTCGFHEGDIKPEILSFVKERRALRNTIDTSTPLQLNIGVIINYDFVEAYRGDVKRAKELVTDRVLRASKAFESGPNIKIAIVDIIVPPNRESDIFVNTISGFDYLDILQEKYSATKLRELNWDFVLGLSYSGFSDVGGVAIGRYSSSNISSGTIAHELGHNLGSPHTHSCVWNNGKPLSLCYPVEGDCYNGVLDNIEKGNTVMSYCRSIMEFHPEVTQLLRFNAESIQVGKLEAPSLPNYDVTTDGVRYLIDFDINSTESNIVIQASKQEDFSVIFAEHVYPNYSPNKLWNVGGTDLYFRAKSMNNAGSSDWTSPLKVNFDVPLERIVIDYDKSTINLDEPELIGYSSVEGVDSYEVHYLTKIDFPFYETFRNNKKLELNSRMFRPFYSPFLPNKVKFQIIGFQGATPIVASEVKEVIVETSPLVLEKVIPRQLESSELTINYPYSYFKTGVQVYESDILVSEKLFYQTNILNLNNFEPEKNYKLIFQHFDIEDRSSIISELEFSLFTTDFESKGNLKSIPVDGSYFVSFFANPSNGDVIARTSYPEQFTKVDNEGTSTRLTKDYFKGNISSSSNVKVNSKSNIVALSRMSKSAFEENDAFTRNVYNITEINPLTFQVLKKNEFSTDIYLTIDDFDIENLQYFTNGNEVLKLEGDKLVSNQQINDANYFTLKKWGNSFLAFKAIGSEEDFLNKFDFKTGIVSSFKSTQNPIYKNFSQLEIDPISNNLILYSEFEDKTYLHLKDNSLTEIKLSGKKYYVKSLIAATNNNIIFTGFDLEDYVTKVLVYSLEGMLIREVPISKSNQPIYFDKSQVSNGIAYLADENVIYKAYLNCDKPLETTPLLSGSKDIYYDTDEEINITATGCDNYNWTFTDFATNENQIFTNTNQVSINNEKGGTFKVACMEDECISENQARLDANKYTFLMADLIWPPKCQEDAIFYSLGTNYPYDPEKTEVKLVLKGESETREIPYFNPWAPDNTGNIVPKDLIPGEYEVNIVAKAGDITLVGTNPQTRTIQANIPDIMVDYNPSAIKGEEVPVNIEVLNGSSYYELNGILIQQAESVYDTSFTMNDLGTFTFDIDYGTFPWCVNQEQQNFSESYSIAVIALSSEEEGNISVNVFPNPSSQSLHIEPQKAFNSASYQFLNTKGELIYKGDIDKENTILKLGHLPTGTYFLNGLIDGERFVKKVVKE